MRLRKATQDSGIRFSYSAAGQPLAQRVVIQMIEKLSGQRRLKKLYELHRAEASSDENFFATTVRLLRIEVQYDPASLELVPTSEPVLFVANHPYGVLDGILLSWLASKVRSDVKVLANCTGFDRRQNECKTRRRFCASLLPGIADEHVTGSVHRLQNLRFPAVRFNLPPDPRYAEIDAAIEDIGVATVSNLQQEGAA